MTYWLLAESNVVVVNCKAYKIRHIYEARALRESCSSNFTIGKRLRICYRADKSKKPSVETVGPKTFGYRLLANSSDETRR